MANTFTNLKNSIYANRALEAFVARLAPLGFFSTNFSAEAVAKGDKIRVPYISGASAAQDFNGTYTIQGATAEGLDITIDKRKFVSWGLTTEEMSTQPAATLDRFAVQKGNALAKAVLQDIWSTITAANFGNTAYSQGSGGSKVAVSAANFDSAEVVALAECADVDDWPEQPRGLVLSPAYYNALLGDADIIGTNGIRSDTPLRDATVREIAGFQTLKSNVIPSNGENLVGFAVNPDAILVAMRTLIPEEGVAGRPNVRTLTDADSGISIVLREWFDPDTDTVKRVLEAHYGYRVGGNAKAIKRLVSS
jgi:hypothetical protein